MGGLKSDHSYSGSSANHSNWEHFCEICNTQFEDAEGLNEHTARVHGTHRSRPLERLDPLLREILENKKAIIHRRDERGAIQNPYNFPLPDRTGSLTYTDLENQLEQIFASEENALFQRRESTKWNVYVVTNVRWVVIKTTFPLGDGQNSSYLVRNKTSIVSLANHPDKRIPYKYKLCVFRCLAYHRSKNCK